MPAGAHAVHEIQIAIRGYLLLHPQAADTAVGIRQWWLPKALRSMSVEWIRIALEDMVENGELHSDVLTDGSRLYALRRPSTGNGGIP